VRRTCRLGRRASDWPALHEDDGLLTITADGCRCQTQHVLGLGPLQNGVKRCSANVVALVHDHLTVVFYQRVHLALPRDGLHHGNVEATLRHCVLVRKQPVIGFQLQLPGARAGMADDGGAKAPDVTCGHTAGEKHPRVCAIPGPKDFQRSWYAQFVAGLHEGSRVIAPVGLVKIDSQESASIQRTFAR
jgi:hypothetical protein